MPTHSASSYPSSVAAGTQAAFADMGDAEPSSTDLLATITSLKETLTSKINTVTTEVSLIRHDMDIFCFQLPEWNLASLRWRTWFTPTPGSLRSCKKQVQSLHEKTVDMENRLCRNNLRVVEIPERAKRAKPAEFAKGFLATLLGHLDLPSTFIVERTHRVPTMPPIPGPPPRPFLIKLLNYRDRDRCCCK